MCTECEQLRAQFAAAEQRAKNAQIERGYFKDQWERAWEEIHKLRQQLAAAQARLPGPKSMVCTVAEWDRLWRELDAAQAELERWRHGEQVEGDYVCPDSLALDAAEARIRHLEEAYAGVTARSEEALAAAQARMKELEGSRLYRELLDRADKAEREGAETLALCHQRGRQRDQMQAERDAAQEAAKNQLGIIRAHAANEKNLNAQLDSARRDLAEAVKELRHGTYRTQDRFLARLSAAKGDES